jgi:hypothetical protein
VEGRLSQDNKESKQKIGNRVRKKKFDYMNMIFQAITDLTYFLEFIEANYDELNETFALDLKNLFGYNSSFTPDEFKSEQSFNSARSRNPGGPLMRLIRATLLLDCPTKINNLDFRTAVLSGILLSPSIKALLSRFDGFEEKILVTQDIQRTEIWARYLEKQVKDKYSPSNRRIGYYPYR